MEGLVFTILGLGLLFGFGFLCGFGNLNGLGIGGLVDMKPICGIIVARRKVRAGKEGKVSPTKMKIYRYVRQYLCTIFTQYSTCH